MNLSGQAEHLNRPALTNLLSGRPQIVVYDSQVRGFRDDLFTVDEQLTLVEASMTFLAIKLWYDKAVGARFIDIDDPRTVLGLQALVDENLISAERMASVLAAGPPV
jgi:hypothetical protein